MLTNRISQLINEALAVKSQNWLTKFAVKNVKNFVRCESKNIKLYSEKPYLYDNHQRLAINIHGYYLAKEVFLTLK